MQDRPKIRSGSLGFTIAATAVVVVAAGGGMTWWAFKSLFNNVIVTLPEGKGLGNKSQRKYEL